MPRHVGLSPTKETTETVTKKISTWSNDMNASLDTMFGNRIVAMDGGRFVGTTDSGGYLYIPHSLPRAPTSVLITPVQSPGVAFVNVGYTQKPGSIYVHLFKVATGPTYSYGDAASLQVTLNWLAFIVGSNPAR